MLKNRVAIRKQNGFTIIEAIISLGLGLLLTAALIQVFDSTGKISNVEGALARMQETGRFALDTLVKDIRLAGYGGCLDPQPDLEETNSYRISFFSTQLQGTAYLGTGLIGYEVTAAGAFDPAAITPMTDLEAGGGISARPGTDVISVNFASQIGAEVQSNVGGGDLVVVDNPLGLAGGDLLLVSDCYKGHVFEATSVTGAGPFTIVHDGTTNTYIDIDGDTVPDEQFDPDYDTNGGKVYLWNNRTYFVADTGRTTDEGNIVYGLFQRSFDGVPQELLEGIENLQIEYGQQVPGQNGAIRYVSADDADLDYRYVVSVRIGLLVQSFEQVTDAPDNISYQLPGGTVIVPGDGIAVDTHATDRSLRKPFIATVKLRNRRVLDLDI